MSDSFAKIYWKGLRRLWKDGLVEETVRKFNDLSYVLEVADNIGYDKAQVLSEIDSISNDETELGWKIYDSIWQDVFQKILSVRDDLSFEVKKLPLIGTLPTGKINALAILVPNTSSHILAFEVGLIQFISGISDYASLHLKPSESNGPGFDFVQTIDQGKAKDISEMIINYITKGIPTSKNRVGIKNKQQHSLSIGFRNIVKLFVAGHEFGHVGLRHLEQGKKHMFSLLDDSDGCTISYPSYLKEEFDADRVGIIISLVYHFKRGLPYWFSASLIVYFLRFTQAVDKGIFDLFGVTINNTQHPSIDKRVEQVESVLFDLIREEEKKNYYALSSFFMNLIDAFNIIFDEELAVAKQTADLKLAPVWKARIF